MTESAEDRSKRKFIKHLTSADWNYQVTVFYKTEEASKANAIEDSKKLRKMLGKEFNQYPWLYRLCLLHRKFGVSYETSIDEETGEITTEKTHYEIEEPEHIAYHTFFTTSGQFPRSRLDKIKRLMTSCCGAVVNIRGQNRFSGSYREDDLARYIGSIKTQKPHNLTKYFGTNPHRFSLINEAALSEPSKHP
jgi:hypothetical protein